MNPLQVGDLAPDFSNKDQHGNLVTLSDLRGRRVILYFYPKDNTPGCTAEACSLRNDHEALREKGFTVIGISPDSSASHERFAAKHELGFTLLSDPDHRTAEAYGAWGEKKFMGRTYQGILRTTFVIDAEGRIERVFRKVDTKTHGQQILAACENR